MPYVRKTVYLEKFWTQKTVYLRGPCTLGPCNLGPYCNGTFECELALFYFFVKRTTIKSYFILLLIAVGQFKDTYIEEMTRSNETLIFFLCYFLNKARDTRDLRRPRALRKNLKLSPRNSDEF